jgi:MFS family permease
VNVPIGVLVYLLSLKYISPEYEKSEHLRLDVLGAITITSALMFIVYGIVNGSVVGWTSLQTLGVFGAAFLILIAFVVNESRVTAPLIPLDLFKLRNLATANVVGVLWAGAMFAWFFLSALYLQLVLHYNALHVGFAFLPANIIMAIFSFSLSAKFVNWYGIKRPLVVGLLLAATGLLLLAFAPIAANYWIRVFPSMILLGIGAGIAFNPVLLAAMNDVAPHESGIASGIVNTSFMMGGALGLAILASLAASRTSMLLSKGSETTAALLSGYHLAFFVGASFAFIAALLSALLLKTRGQTHAAEMPTH